MIQKVELTRFLAAASEMHAAGAAQPVTEAVAASADAHFLVLNASGRPSARCSVWWKHTPSTTGECTGVVGHFAADDAPGAAMLLDAACDALRAADCTVAIGPMDGSTWQRYRLVTEAGPEPPFFLEPANPASWPGYFTAAGFVECARYCSALNSDLAQQDERADSRWGAFREAGITIRPIDLDAFRAELRKIYAVAEVAFRDNFLFTPMREQAFVEQYEHLRPYLDPALVLLAEHDGRTVGFSFGIPDVLEAAAGRSSRTAIIKTLAILPERRRYAGLGSVLTARTQAEARDAGYGRCIHALMHESNHSTALSARTARVMRRYALYSRTLQP